MLEIFPVVDTVGVDEATDEVWAFVVSGETLVGSFVGTALFVADKGDFVGVGCLAPSALAFAAAIEATGSATHAEHFAAAFFES